VAIDSDTAVARASLVLHGLQFSEADQQRPTSSFSGGWRMRISLALALFIQPDVLLLDEPTNHLDLHAVIWLEDYLCNHWKKTLIVVSHAREFLNTVCTDTLHLNDEKKILRYKNANYDEWERQKLQHDLLNAKEAQRHQKQCAEMKKFVERQDNTSKSAMGLSRMKVLAKMAAATQRLKDEAELSFVFPKPEAGKGTILGNLVELTDVGFGYSIRPATVPETLLFSDVTLSLDRYSRVALVGPNGVGK
jgi:ATP-binding cassette subfamily F protein 3